MTINTFMHIYIGENAHWDIYAPPPGKSITQLFFQIIIFFFHFRCILLQISHQKCFFISISIPGRSGVKVLFDLLLDKNVCPKIVRLLYFMYTNQLCHVK